MRRRVTAAWSRRAHSTLERLLERADRRGLEVQLDGDSVDEAELVALLRLGALHVAGVGELGAIAIDAAVDDLHFVVRVRVAVRLEAVLIDVDVGRAAARVLLADLRLRLRQREQR